MKIARRQLRKLIKEAYYSFLDPNNPDTIAHAAERSKYHAENLAASSLGKAMAAFTKLPPVEQSRLDRSWTNQSSIEAPENEQAAYDELQVAWYKSTASDTDGDGTSDKKELMAIALNMEDNDVPSPDASWKELHTFFHKDYSAKRKKANQKYKKWHNRDRTQGKYGWNVSKDWEDLLSLIDANQAQLKPESLGRLKGYMNEISRIQMLITHEILSSPEGSAIREAGYAYLRNMIGAADRHASKMRSGAYGKLD